MITKCSIALENLSGAEPWMDKDQKTLLLRAPYKGLTLFGGKLSSVYKVNVERVKHASTQDSNHFHQPYVAVVDVLRGFWQLL